MQGLESVMNNGIVAGFPIIGVKATLLGKRVACCISARRALNTSIYTHFASLFFAHFTKLKIRVVESADQVLTRTPSNVFSTALLSLACVL